MSASSLAFSLVLALAGDGPPPPAAAAIAADPEDTPAAPAGVTVSEPVPLPEPHGTTTALKYKLAGISDEERAQLDRFLSALVGKPLAEGIAKAKTRIGAIRRYQKVKCAP